MNGSVATELDRECAAVVARQRARISALAALARPTGNLLALAARYHGPPWLLAAWLEARRRAAH